MQLRWPTTPDDRVRRATASLRGAALAVAAAAAGVAERLASRTGCPDDDAACLEDAYADLLAQRRRLDDAATQVQRLEHATLDYRGRTPRDAPMRGADVPTVIAARAMVDRTHDELLETLAAARAALSRLDPQQPVGGALG